MTADRQTTVEVSTCPRDEWDEIPFPETLVRNSVGRENQILSSEIKPQGRFPVVDQGQAFISGYSDAAERVIRAELPLVIFGDHTRCVKFVDFPFILGADGTKVLKPKEDLFDVRFFYYALLSLDIPNRGYNRHFTLLKEKKVPRPEKHEQGKIAEVLGTIQRAIEQQERLLALTAELKKALLHQLFTAGLSGEPQKQTDLGPAPKSWDVAPLASLLEIKHGYAFAGEHFAPQGRYILLTPGHFFEEGGFRDQKDKTKYYLGEFPRGYLLAKGDLLVAMTEQKVGLLGSAIIVPESDKFLHNQRLGLIQNLDEQRLDKVFLFYFFNTVAIRKQIFLTSSGSKVRHTSPGKIRELTITLPSLAEQKEIVQALQAVNAKLEVTKRKVNLFTDLFRTLLHQLMTAQIRVDDLDIEANEVEA
jgi:type I restriction enzyme S subunit